MARQFREVDGTKLWDFFVNQRSKVNPRVRVQRKRLGMQLSDEQAEKYEQNLWRECALEVARKECQGFTWEELFEKWDHCWSTKPTKRWLESTRDDIYARLQNHTKPLFKKKAKDLSEADIEDCLTLAKSGGASFKLCKEIRRSIDIVYRWAMDQKYILGKEFSPCRNVLIESEEPEDDAEKIPLILTKSEIRTFLEKAKEVEHPWYPIWFVALYTGMRAGELNALRKQKVTLVSEEKALELDQLPKGVERDYGSIKVHLSWVKRLGRNGPTKGRWWRTVPVNSKMYWFLAEYLKTANYGSDQDGDRVFAKLSDWDNGRQADVIRDFCKTNNFKEITFHALRACFATQMLESGVGQTTLMKIGGWKSMKAMSFYLRLAGVEEAGKTEGLDFGALDVTPAQIAAMGNVFHLSQFQKGKA